MLNFLVAFLYAHLGSITVGTAIGWTATTLNQIVPEDKGPAWFHFVLGRLGSLDKDGRLSIPIIQGNRPTKTASLNVVASGVDSETGEKVSVADVKSDDGAK